MAIMIRGELWDLGSGLRLQCGTLYSLMNEQTGQIEYALLSSRSTPKADGKKLEGLVGRMVEVLGEENYDYPGAEVGGREVAEIHQR